MNSKWTCGHCRLIAANDNGMSFQNERILRAAIELVKEMTLGERRR